MKKNEATESKKSKLFIVTAALVTGVLLGTITVFFVRTVQRQLWQQSMASIMESTQQGRNTLQIQLRGEYEVMGTVASHLREYAGTQAAELDEYLRNYSEVDTGILLYLENTACYPDDMGMDENLTEILEKNDQKQGIIAPHISSATGVNVFNLFVQVTLKDGTKGYLIKEYEVDRIVDTFTVSFYQDTGFSYVLDTNGNILIRPPHPNSNKTVQNLFDMLQVPENSQTGLERFTQSLREGKTGWATFTYQEENTVFCYIPLKLDTDWYLVSIIPSAVVNKQTSQIIMRTFTLIGCIILGIALLVLLYFRYVNRANHRLRNQAEYISHLYNAVPEGILLTTSEEPYRFLQVNDEGLRLLGFPEGSPNDTLEGKSLRCMAHSEDYERAVQLFQDTAWNGHKNVFEIRIRKKNDSYFWATGIVEKTLDQNGHPVFIIAFHDITEEKLAKEEAKRRDLQERLTLVGAISNAYPLIISLNLSHDTLKFVYIRPGLMLSIGGQQSYSELYADMAPSIHEDHREHFKQRFAPEYLLAALGGERDEISGEYKHLLADGKYHWISTQIIAVDNPYSEDKLAILISRRIDEQRYEEEQQQQTLKSALESARAANVAKSQFLSNMSHDIRTPMNAVIGMAAIAAAHPDDPDRVADCLKKIDISSRHLLSLINDVLDMSKIESRKLSIREEPFNFAELVTDVIELFRPQTAECRLKLDVHLAVLENEAVIGDSLRIRQVYINILSNAVKYTPSDGKIRVDVRQVKESHNGYSSFIFRCSDTGIGMSEEFQKRLFEPFERVQDTTSSKIVGTGLGMAITKNLVDLMDGSIRVESKLGKGSSFTVSIPLKLQAKGPETAPLEWSGARCLIADSDPQVSESMVELLEDMGMHASSAASGEEAVSFVLQAKDTQDPIRLVILGLKMPDMDGGVAARCIREAVENDIPAVVLTAYDQAELESEARSCGATAILTKPLYREKISSLLRKLSGDEEAPKPMFNGTAGDFNGKRVLLVEDNEINLEIARTLIEESGVQVEEAYNGEEAVRKVSESAERYYDLVFMDIQMPVMDGYQATKAIRALNRDDALTLPIVAMTANAFEEDVCDALQAGMNVHLAKPVDVAELGQVLQRFLGQKI